MSLATYHDFSIEQGSDFKITFQYSDEAGNNIDLTNWSVVLQWRTNDNILYTFSNREITNDYSLIADSSGSIVLQIPSATTLLYNFDNAVYDLDIQETTEQYYNSGLKTYRLVTGNITLIKRNIPINLSAFIDTSYNNSSIDSQNICCSSDPYAISYNGSFINILDNSTTSGVINVQDNRTIENIEVFIDGLNHSSPQDLSFILEPPSGNKVLLAANNKIKNYKNNFSFAFSNKATPGLYLNDVAHRGKCNILDKTNITKHNSDILSSSIDHLIGYSISGDWGLIVKDTDIGASGYINAWQLIITYSS